MRIYFKEYFLCVNSGFRPEFDENCALLSYYAASSLQFPIHISGQPIGPIFNGQESLEN